MTGRLWESMEKAETVASSGPLREHHDTGSTPGKGFNYVLDVHNADDVLTDRFYLYNSVTELLGDGERASVYSARKGVTLTLQALDLSVPVYEEPDFSDEVTAETETPSE